MATGLPDWPLFTPDKQVVQILDTKVHSETSAMEPRCQFWETHKINRIR